jgi:hypothetical protein
MPIINGEEVMRRVRRERDRFVGFVLEGVENIDEKHHIQKHAVFLITILCKSGLNYRSKNNRDCYRFFSDRIPKFAELGDRSDCQ